MPTLPTWPRVLSSVLTGLGQGVFVGLLGVEVFAPPIWSPAVLAGVCGVALAGLLAGLVAGGVRTPRRAALLQAGLVVGVGLHALALWRVGQDGVSVPLLVAIGLSATADVILCAALWWSGARAAAAFGLAHGLALATACFALALPRIGAQPAPGALPGYDFAPDLAVFDAAHASVGALAWSACVVTLLAAALRLAAWRRDGARATVGVALAVGLGVLLPLVALAGLALPAAYPPAASAWALLAVVGLQTAGVLCDRRLLLTET